MFKDFISKLGQSVNFTEVYDYLELNKGDYSRFVKSKIIENEFAELNKDYFASLQSENHGKRGQFRQEYILHIDFAKKICMVSKSKKAEEIRNYLVSLTKQVEQNELLNHEQIIELVKLKEFFKYVENQKQITKNHLEKFISENNSTNIYAEFHTWRNKMLNIDKDVLDTKIKEYCIENSKKLPKIHSNFDKIRFLNQYDSLRNAVWDFLEIKGQINSITLSNLVKKMAEAENLQIFNNNETNLFQVKENINQKSLK